jgi:hypothetical protein
MITSENDPSTSIILEPMVRLSKAVGTPFCSVITRDSAGKQLLEDEAPVDVAGFGESLFISRTRGQTLSGSMFVASKGSANVICKYSRSLKDRRCVLALICDELKNLLQRRFMPYSSRDEIVRKYLYSHRIWSNKIERRSLLERRLTYLC